MVDLVIYLYLAAPVVLGLAAFWYGVTRAPDRIQLASVALFVASVLYFGVAYELTTRGGSSQSVGLALGAYSLSLYFIIASLAIFLKRWAWYVAIGASGVHVILGLASAPSALAMGSKGILGLLAYLTIGAVAAWALLHKGTKGAILASAGREA